MDALISSALEEICYRGSSGVALSSIWGKLSPAPSPSVKATLWSNLLSVPTLRFSVAGKDKLFGPDDPEIQLVEDAEKLKLKVVANEHLRDCFVGLYDVPSCGVRPLQRRALERIAISREDGVTQSQLCKEFGMEGRNFFYIVKNLESRNLIVRQPAIVKTKEAGGAGEMKSSVSTNLMYLSRYATRLGAQQRFEINKEEHALGSLSDLEEADVDEENSAGDCLKDAVLVKDFIPAMQAICEKLEIANGNVLVITDIKKDLGYIGRFGHRAWRRIFQKLKDAGIVEEFDAKVNEKVERCIHLLKKFCPKLFETKQLRGSRACDENRQLKFGRKPKLNEQLLELPINQQIYDLIDENGTDGAIGIEVCSRLGLDKKKTYERFYDLVSRFGMHCQAENHKKTAVYRYWTSVHYNPQASNAQMDKLETSAGLPASASASRPFCIDAPDQTTLISSMNNRLISGVDCAYQRNLSDGGEDSKSSKFLEDGKANSGLVPDIDHVTSGAVSSAGLDLVCVDVESNGALSESSQISLLKQPSAHQTPVTADNSLREQRILEHIQKEKIVLRVVLHKLLLGLEKDKGTIMDRRTIDRILNKLQKEGHCRCVTFHVPSVTNCGRSRMAHVILHSSIESVLPEKVYDMLREFEKLSRQGSSRCKVDSVFPVLSGVNRTQAPVDSDGQAARSEAMRTNGFVLAKMVRAKLLHTFLWDYLSTSEEWDGNLSSGYKLFALQGAVKAIPLELFLQVAGSTQKIDNLVEKCKLGLRLRDLPAEEYRSLMDTLATGRLSVIIDLLRRLKLIRLIPVENTEDGVMFPHALFTDAMEFKPYIEEPPAIVAKSIDLRPRYRHDFVLSSREAVEDYWKTLEFCYAAADPKAAFYAFPGSAVPENIQEFVLPCTPSDNAQNLGHGKRSESRKRLRRHNLHQKFIKCLNESSDAGTELYKSVAVSNAVELLKLVFLSSSTTPDLQNMLGETLRHYSERDIFTAFSYLRDSKILIGGNGGPFVLSQHFLHNISKSPFPTNTGKRAAKFSNWLHDGKNYLIGGGIDLKEDLQCGDLFHLFARVSSGEMSVSPCLPDEGLGEADDLRISKRKAETDVPCDSEKAKKMKSMRDGELFSRREKGFPGIRVSICCEKILPVDALESLDDGKNGTDNSQKDKMECGFVQIDSHVPQSPNFDNITPSARLSGNSSWEAMSGYASYLYSNLCFPKEGGLFSPKSFQEIYKAIHKAGDQGLSFEEVTHTLDMPGEKMAESVIDVLQTFGRVLKVNAYDSVRVVDALYVSKYSLTLRPSLDSNPKPPSVTEPHERSDNCQPENKVVVESHVAADQSIMGDNDVHRVTILNLPEEAVPLIETQSRNSQESDPQDQNLIDIHERRTDGKTYIPILPWVNGDGTTNRVVYRGLVRRALGTVMQYPGILEEEIIKRMDVLNPQSCRRLLELMVLDSHLMVRKMHQLTGNVPPTLLLRKSSRFSKPSSVYRNHFFANPRSTYLL
ncbi:hypothetical protein LINPERHAP1_LOCUS16885 [Linum perenne]